jgi:hypothetical protein
MIRPCRAPLAILGALLALPAVAGAAPITVTYEVTGGDGFGRGGFYEGVSIQSGTIVVTFPNPGSGTPPLQSADASIQVSFVTTQGSFQGIHRETFRPTSFPTGMAFRGAGKTLTATRSRSVELSPGRPGHWFFRLRADANGLITAGHSEFLDSPTGTARGFFRITGREIAATPEPASGLLLAIGSAGIGSAAALARRRWR